MFWNPIMIGLAGFIFVHGAGSSQPLGACLLMLRNVLNYFSCMKVFLCFFSLNCYNLNIYLLDCSFNFWYCLSCFTLIYHCALSFERLCSSVWLSLHCTGAFLCCLRTLGCLSVFKTKWCLLTINFTAGNLAKIFCLKNLCCRSLDFIYFIYLFFRLVRFSKEKCNFLFLEN